MSAAVLDYPPPILLGYGAESEDQVAGHDMVRVIKKYLFSNGTEGDDLILVVDKGMTALQLG
jgi:hypothetical protein